jgi:hypothetical protein
VLEIRVIYNPTPICGNVKGKLVDRNSNGYTLLLVARVSIGSISILIGLVVTTTCTTYILIGRGTIFKHVPSLSGLVGFVVTTSCSFYLGIEIWEVALMVLVPFPISTKKIWVVHT